MRLTGAVLRGAAVLAVGVAALVLGFAGLRTYLAHQAGNEFGTGWLDILYQDVQLFVLNSGAADGPGPIPLTLQIARFLAPATTIVAGLETLRLLLGEQLRRWASAAASKHAVVTGDGVTAVELALRLRADYRTVVLVSSAPATAAQARQHGLLDVTGDPADAATLRAAGVGRAEVVFACADESATNAATVLSAREITQPRGRSLATYAQVRDAEICVALRARRIGAGGDPHFSLDFFTVEEIAARALLDQYPLPAPDGRAGRVAIAGFGRLGRAVLRETARRRVAGGPPVAVTVHGGTDEAVARFLARFPEITRNATVTVAPAAPPVTAAAVPAVTFVCLPDNDEALLTGLAAAQSQAGTAHHVVICLNDPSPFGAVIGGRSALLDDVEGRLAVFEVVKQACVPGLIRADTADQLSRAIHRAYVQSCLARGDTPEVNHSMRPWEDLPEDLREASRAQAAGIGAKLAAINAVIVPESAAVPGFAFTDPEIERLAEMEHQRWVKERTSRGYEYGPSREGNKHPDLVDWAYLSPRAQDKDRDAVRELPAILDEAGFQILRLPAAP
jgi:hypothetical protein